jgi:hypothetical protein
LIGSSFGPRSAKARVGIGAVGSLVPRGFEGLEVGASRFFHLTDSPVARDFEALTLPFQELFKAGSEEANVLNPRQANQVASLFMRLAPPGSNVELYGELYREDHSLDTRDLLGEPDHASAYVIGIHANRWHPSAESGTTVTIEAVNGRISHLNRVRRQGPAYVHTRVVGGHTLRGKTLGSQILPGGGGLTFLANRHSGSRTVGLIAELARSGQKSEGGTWNGELHGYYTIGVRGALARDDGLWSGELRIQPGYGDIPGTNVHLMLMAVR